MTVQSEAEMRKLALTSLAGTSIEWFDFFLYGTAAALVFPVLFFSEDMPRYVSLIASFSTFAVGFLARPLGGVIFGHYGDRFGRKKALIIALTLMVRPPPLLVFYQLTRRSDSWLPCCWFFSDLSKD